MGKPSRDKGARRERELVQLLRDSGLDAERVPLSGACGGTYAGDVRLGDKVLEVKARADGFRQLYGWLDGADALALKADRRPWLVVLRLDDWLNERSGA